MTQLFAGSAATDAGRRLQLARGSGRENTRCLDICCALSLLLYPRIHPFSDSARRKVTNETPVVLEDALSAKLVETSCSQ